MPTAVHTKPPTVQDPCGVEQLREIMSALEDRMPDAKAKLAVLIRLAEACAFEERPGTETHLDELFWRGVERIGRDVLHELERIEQVSETDSGFVTIADEPEGGAR